MREGRAQARPSIAPRRKGLVGRLSYGTGPPDSGVGALEASASGALFGRSTERASSSWMSDTRERCARRSFGSAVLGRLPYGFRARPLSRIDVCWPPLSGRIRFRPAAGAEAAFAFVGSGGAR